MTAEREDERERRTRLSFRVMSVRRAETCVIGEGEEAERRAGRRNALLARKDIVEVERRHRGEHRVAKLADDAVALGYPGGARPTRASKTA